jgi:glutathionyl-hydroquinone reductase
MKISLKILVSAILYAGSLMRRCPSTVLPNQILLEVNGLPYDIYLAESQKEYDKNFDAFFGRLDDFEKTLGKKRYLLGEKITDSDTKLFPTLVRFDAVYYHSFRANRNSRPASFLSIPHLRGRGPGNLN